MKIKKWDLIDSKIRLECGIFKIEEKVFRSPRTGQTHPFISARGTDWINIIPLTSNNDIVLVRQFRQSREMITLEIPGGMVDPGEEPLEAAKRELLEETGYSGDSSIYLGAVDPNPAILDLKCHTYLVENVQLTSKPKLDGTEDIEVDLLPLADMPKLIKDGQITHSLVITAFSLLELHRGGFKTLRA